MSTHSRAVLVTGCSSGIGHANALRLVQAGYPVYATARSAAVQQNRADLPGSADDSSPYGAFNAAVARATAAVYAGGLLSRLGGDPEDVAAAILRSITATSPRPHHGHATRSPPRRCC